MIDSLNCGGAEKSLVTLLPYLTECGYDITLVLGKQKGDLLKYVPNKVKIMPFPFKPTFTQRLIHFFSRKNPFKKNHWSETYWKHIGKNFPELEQYYDVAIAYQQGFPTFFIAEKVKANKKICWINSDLKAARYSSKFCFSYYKKYNNIIAVSKSLPEMIVKDGYIDSSDKEKVLICNDISDEKLIRSLATEFYPFSKNNKIKIVTVARLSPPKGHDLAIEAAKILKERGVNFEWHFIGDGPLLDHIKKQISKENLSNYIILQGLKINPYPYIKECDIYVQPSKFEGYGITIAEAKILCKPIVSTNFPVIYDQLINNVSGLIVNMNSESIAESIHHLITNPDLRLKFEQNLKSSPNHTAQTEVKKIYNLIES